jgi:hypothetical protein
MRRRAHPCAIVPPFIGCVAISFFRLHDSRENRRRVVQEKLKPVTVRVEPRVWRGVERLAAADKRPVANYLRVILAELVAAKSTKQAAA